VHRALGIRKRAGLLAPGGRRQHHVGVPGGLGKEEILDDDEKVLLFEYLLIRESSGREIAGLVALIQRKEIEPCSA
jgi:hypothetical protein